MKSKDRSPGTPASGRVAWSFLLALLVLLAGCAGAPQVAPQDTAPPAVGEDAGPVPALAYYQTLQRMTAAQIGRERMVLAALPQSPINQIRVAMVLGHPRGQQDLVRALALLDAVLKSAETGAIGLHPLARVLADNYGERQKLEVQADKQGQQLKESQRKALELQEKIDGLTEIERTLPQRPRATRPAGGER